MHSTSEVRLVLVPNVCQIFGTAHRSIPFSYTYIQIGELHPFHSHASSRIHTKNSEYPSQLICCSLCYSWSTNSKTPISSLNSSQCICVMSFFYNQQPSHLKCSFEIAHWLDKLNWTFFQQHETLLLIQLTRWIAKCNAQIK